MSARAAGAPFQQAGFRDPPRALNKMSSPARESQSVTDDTVLRAHAPWCRSCPLRKLPAFEDFDEAELRFMERFKLEHRLVMAGADLQVERMKRRFLATLFSGWAMRYKVLPDGRRHVVAVLLPGDLIGLDTVVYGVAQSSVQALTDLTYCALDVRQVAGFLTTDSRVAYRILWRATDYLQRQEFRAVRSAVGTATERLAGFFVDLHARLVRLRLVENQSFAFPMTQQQIADHIGINVVHLNRVMRTLREGGVLHADGHRIVIDDLALLENLARVRNECVDQEPLI
jgi:CRP-like cAMP-binding protein